MPHLPHLPHLPQPPHMRFAAAAWRPPRPAKRVPRASAAALCLGLLAVFAVQAQPMRVTTEVVASGLQNPWAVAFLGDGRMLVTERPGRLRVVAPNGTLSAPLAGVPAVDAVGQGGLLDLITDRDFPRNRLVHFCFAEPAAQGGGNSTALATARLSDDATRLDNVKVIFSQQPKVSSRLHFGCRIVQAADRSLFLTLGDRYHRMNDAQTLDNHHGKVVRVQPDGSPHPDNPFRNQPGALPDIWSLGHRNPQGATLGPGGRLWISEHGPQGGDEINRPEAGKNHGWPVITYGENYGGGRIGQGLTEQAGMEQPLYQWTPSVAPAGMAFVTSDRYGKAWQGSLLVGALKFRYLARLEMDGERVVKEEKLLPNLGQRVRDVRQGPDGFIYLLTDDRDGQVLRLLPQR